MFGHDNNADDNKGAGSITLPSASDDVAATGLPTPGARSGDELGGFLSGNNSTGGALPTDDLLDIKQQALKALTPLVDHLDQSPEEKFRTTMMMIQASDDQSLIKVAYEAAKGITDEKERAQALLDIVNEINYFTQQNQA